MSMLNLLWIVPLCVAAGYALACLVWMAADPHPEQDESHSATRYDADENAVRVAHIAAGSTATRCEGSGVDCCFCPVFEDCDAGVDVSKLAQRWLADRGIPIVVKR